MQSALPQTAKDAMPISHEGELLYGGPVRQRRIRTRVKVRPILATIYWTLTSLSVVFLLCSIINFATNNVVMAGVRPLVYSFVLFWAAFAMACRFGTAD
jgi:hypothetical protein